MVFVTRPEAEPAGAVTGTEIVQLPGLAGLPGGVVLPVDCTLVAVAERTAGGTPRWLVSAPAITKGVGKLSVRFTPVYGVPLGFCNVMVSVVTVWPATIVEAPKLLE